jgi:hypothetical protein
MFKLIFDPIARLEEKTGRRINSDARKSATPRFYQRAWGPAQTWFTC